MTTPAPRLSERACGGGRGGKWAEGTLLQEADLQKGGAVVVITALAVLVEDLKLTDQPRSTETMKRYEFDPIDV